MSNWRQFWAVSACAVAAAMIAAPAHADVLAFDSSPGNFSFSTATATVPIRSNGKAAVNFEIEGTKKKVVVISFSAECSVDAPANDVGSWVDIDILVDGVAVSPTGITQDGFCSADGQVGFSGWVRPAAIVAVRLEPGKHKVSVLARLNSGATGGWISDSAIVVQD